MSFSVRVAEARDVPGIISVELAAKRVGTGGVDRFEAALVGAMADSERLVLVAAAQVTAAAVENSTIVAWAKTHHWDYSDGPAQAGHYLGGITVAPGYRRRGVAVELTQVRLDWIWKRASEAWFVVNVRNEASLELHRRWGFREVARGSSFHTVTFDGGEGILLRASRPLH